VNHYLVVFDRAKGKIIRHQSYRNRDEALGARFEEERKHRRDSEIEVVVLGAASWDALRHTHGRYFKRFDQLAASGRD
jgi:hypothetical protein